jgi:hypothetical protein
MYAALAYEASETAAEEIRQKEAQRKAKAK